MSQVELTWSPGPAGTASPIAEKEKLCCPCAPKKTRYHHHHLQRDSDDNKSLSDAPEKHKREAISWGNESLCQEEEEHAKYVAAIDWVEQHCSWAPTSPPPPPSRHNKEKVAAKKYVATLDVEKHTFSFTPISSPYRDRDDGDDNNSDQDIEKVAEDSDIEDSDDDDSINPDGAHEVDFENKMMLEEEACERALKMPYLVSDSVYQSIVHEDIKIIGEANNNDFSLQISSLFWPVEHLWGPDSWLPDWVKRAEAIFGGKFKGIVKEEEPRSLDDYGFEGKGNIFEDSNMKRKREEEEKN